MERLGREAWISRDEMRIAERANKASANEEEANAEKTKKHTSAWLSAWVSSGAWTPKRQQDMDGVGKMADA